MSDRFCLQCGETEAAIKSSQSTPDPIFCGAVDYFGECELCTEADDDNEGGEKP